MIMKKIFLSVIAVLYFSINYGQNYWQKTSESKMQSTNKMDRASMPTSYKLYSLDIDTFKKALLDAPSDLESKKSNLVLPFPTAEGEIEHYTIFEASIMEPELEAKFPDIKSYVGKGIEDPTATIRFSITLFGIHCMRLSSEETSYIDTYTTDNKNYIVYSKSSVSPSRPFECLVKNSEKQYTLDNINNTILRASDGKFRIFRLAMACTIEYAKFHVDKAGLSAGTLAQKKGAVLAAMNVTMTRVNGIYEKDLSMRMTLIGANDNIIFIDSDNFSNNNDQALLNEGQTQITNIIGDANFDIGHVVCTGGGGLAGPTPCVNGRKARGITGTGSPVGDSFDVDYVAHEMGHQFGAGHTFNGDAENCAGGNRDESVSVEPGSGTTIMAYAGICSPQNVQTKSDAYFHAVSIAQIVNQINRSSNCAATTTNNNAAPVTSAGADYIIPKETAFVLRGSATDANNDALTYCWEQIDIQVGTPIPSSTATGGANFRSLNPSTAPNRFFPKLSDIIAGNLAPKWEVIPTVGRDMNFALTVRDNKTPNGGQTGRDDMKVTVNGTAGPFKVTSQATTGISWQGNSTQTITWDVAGTTANGVNTANVKISLSTDNGLTFPTVLLASTPNDGTQTITVPNNIDSTNCRIMIEGLNNIFLAVNTTKFTITKGLRLDDFEFDNFSLAPNPNNGNFNIRLTSYTDNNIIIAIHDMRGRAIYEKAFFNNGDFNVDINLNNVEKGIYLASIIDGPQRSVKRIIIE
jgi:hypothetical protein